MTTAATLSTRYPHLAATLVDATERSPFAHHGLRVVDDATEAKVGVVLAPSRRWIDGTPTDETVGGTSALGFSDEGTARRAIARAAAYSGRYLILVGAGSMVDGGEDHGEVILVDPRVLAVLDLGA